MQTQSPLQQPPKSSISLSGIAGAIRNIYVTLSILGLLATNIATLVNDTLHTLAFDALNGILQSASSLLVGRTANFSDSPTVKRRTDVTRRTATLEAEKAELYRQKSHLEVEKGNLTQKAAVLQQSYEDLDTQHKKLSSDHRDLDAKHTKLSTDHQNLTTAHQNLARTEKLRQEKVRNMSARMAPRVAGIAFKSMGTLPARALPAAGAAASVAFTAWELSELCVLMRDLEGLNQYFGNAFTDPNSVCGIPTPNLADFHF